MKATVKRLPKKKVPQETVKNDPIEEEEISDDEMIEKIEESKKIEEPMGKVVLIREEGILRIGTEEDLKSKEWLYKNRDASGNYTLVDMDHGKAKPLVKTILNALDLFPEMRMLKTIRWTLWGMILLILFMFLVDVGRSAKGWQIEELSKKIEAQGLKAQEKPADKIKEIISRNQGTDK